MVNECQSRGALDERWQAVFIHLSALEHERAELCLLLRGTRIRLNDLDAKGLGVADRSLRTMVGRGQSNANCLP